MDCATSQPSSHLLGLVDHFRRVYAVSGLFWARGVSVTFPTIAPACKSLQTGDVTEALTFDHIRQMVSVAPALIHLEAPVEFQGLPSADACVIVFPQRARRATSQAMINTAVRKFQKCLNDFTSRYQPSSSEPTVKIPCARAPTAAPTSFRYGRLNDEDTVLERKGGRARIDQFIAHLKKSQNFYQGQISYTHEVPARIAQFVPIVDSAHLVSPSFQLPPVIADRLRSLGITSLFSHQATSIELLRTGASIVLATSTSSGKSLVYNTVVWERILKAPQTRALYLFPTKALAQDQLRAVRELLGANITCDTFDGDSSATSRSLATVAHIILSNPDMIHSMLSHHANFAEFFMNLSFVVMDETHVYRGTFGSHTSLVMRRLRRVCAQYGSNPVFVCCSATIANPKELAEAVTGARMKLVDQDGSPSGRRTFLLWNPPLVMPPGGNQSSSQNGPAEEKTGEKDLEPLPTVYKGSKTKQKSGKQDAENQSPNLTAAQKKRVYKRAKMNYEYPGPSPIPSSSSSSSPLPSALPSSLNAESVDASISSSETGTHRPVRRSAIFESAILTSKIVQHGLSALCFCNARNVAESINMSCQSLLKSTSSTSVLANFVKAYRGGYTPADRRRLEAQLFSGELRGVVATSALELGVDIGSLDATVHVGFPSSVASLWQQAGRSGRGSQDCLSIFVGYAAPLDQFFMRHPLTLFKASVEEAIVDPDIPELLESHLMCAAMELPLIEEDCAWFGSGFAVALQSLIKKGALIHGQQPVGLEGRGGGWSLCPGQWQQAFVGHEILPKSPATAFSLRSSVDSKYTVTEDDNVIDSLDASQALFEIYPGAIYIHQAETYEVESLDLEKMIARVTPKPNVKYYTRCQSDTEVLVLHRFRPLPVSSPSPANLSRSASAPPSFHFASSTSSSASSTSVSSSSSPFTPSSNSSSSPLPSVSIPSSPSAPTSSYLDQNVFYGRVKVLTRVYAFSKVWKLGGHIFETHTLNLPVVSRQTTAFWIDMPTEVQNAVIAENRKRNRTPTTPRARTSSSPATPSAVPFTPCTSSSMSPKVSAPTPLSSVSGFAVPQSSSVDFMLYRGGLHAIAHSLLALFPLFVMCDSISDFATECGQDEGPMRIMLFGTSSSSSLHVACRGAARMNLMLSKCREAIVSCQCEEGCPGCIQTPQCTDHNRLLDKRAAIFILNLILPSAMSASPSAVPSRSFSFSTPLARGFSSKQPTADYANSLPVSSVLPCTTQSFQCPSPSSLQTPSANRSSSRVLSDDEDALTVEKIHSISKSHTEKR